MITTRHQFIKIIDGQEIEDPPGFGDFIKLLCKKTDAPESESRQTAERIWLFYCLHKAEKMAYSNELSKGRQAQLSEWIDEIFKFAKSKHEELTGPELRGTAEAMLGEDYDNLEEALCKVWLIAGVAERERARTSRLYKRRRGENGEFGITHGARTLIDFYEKWTGRKANISHHDYGEYSGPVFDILLSWKRLTGVEVSSAGVNSLFNRAKKLEI